jgi:flagellar protein FlaG
VVIRPPLDAPTPLPVTAVGGGVAAADPQVHGQGASAAPPPSREAVQAAVDDVNKVLAQSNRAIEFSIDPDVKTVVVKVIDKQDGSVLRQVPSQEMLAIAKALDQMQGLLVRSRA